VEGAKFLKNYQPAKKLAPPVASEAQGGVPKLHWAATLFVCHEVQQNQLLLEAQGGIPKLGQ